MRRIMVLRPAWAKSPSQSAKMRGMAMHACHSVCAQSINRKMEVQVSPEIKMRPYWRRELKQKGLGA
jgi:hypothetical protein